MTADDGRGTMSGARGRSHFETTRWSVVLAAGGGRTPDARAALTVLCERYWYPLYAYLRRSGHSATDAEDLAQGFFLRLLEKDTLQVADPRRGRFRAFLLTALKHFVLNEWDRERAQKRGGASPLLSLEVSGGEERYRLEPRDETTPEVVYDRMWAETVLENAIDRLHAECRQAGKETLFLQCKAFLAREAEAPKYADVAVALGMAEGAVKVAVHRLRRRYGALLEEEIGQTVASPEEVRDEIRHLIAIVGRNLTARL